MEKGFLFPQINPIRIRAGAPPQARRQGPAEKTVPFCEDAMLFGAPDPAKVGLEKAKLKKGRFALKYSFRGAVRPVITGGEFSGPYAFYGAKQAQ